MSDEFASLTGLIPEIERGQREGWRAADSRRNSSVGYGPVAGAFVHAIYALIEAKPQYDLHNYHAILERKGVFKSGASVWVYDAAQLDIQGVLALLALAYRADYHQGGGLVAELCENGTLLKWLQRLKELA